MLKFWFLVIDACFATYKKVINVVLFIDGRPKMFIYITIIRAAKSTRVKKSKLAIQTEQGPSRVEKKKKKTKEELVIR